jgi:toxin CcdB
MAQFDVHRNTGRLRESVPFVVVVQSSQFDGYRRRLVVPLVKASTVGAPPTLRTLNPTFTIRNVRVVLHPLDLVSMPADQLGGRVGSLAASADAIVSALDEVFTRAWK